MSHNDHFNFTGLKADFLIGRRLQDLLIPETSKSAILKHFNSCVTNNGPVKFEKVLEDIPFSPTISTMLIPVLEKDKLLGVKAICSVTITQKNTTRQSWFEQVFGNISDGVMQVDVNGQILNMNRSILTWTPEMSIGKSCFDALDDESRVVFEMAIKRTLADKKTLFFERSFNQNSQTIWYEISFNPCNYQRESVNLVFREFSKQKEQFDLISDQVDTYEYVFDHIAEALLIFDAEGNIVFANQLAKYLFGDSFSHYEHLRNDIHGTWFINGNDKPLSNPGVPVSKAMDGETIDEIEIWKHYQKEETPYAVSTFPISLKDEEFKGVAWTLRDVSASANARQRLENANQNLDHFVQATAHDLKSPVTNMKNLFSLMQRTDDDGKKQVFLNRIEEGVMKLDDLLGGLMELVDAQKNNELQIEPLRFDQISQFMMEELQEQIQQTNASISLDFSKALTIIYNKAYLRSIFHNMLTNSLKYSKEGEQPMISISTELQGDYVCLTFADNGIGIDLEKYKDELFKPFRRLTSQGSGKGIGLNLVKGFVEKNGGRIDVESKKGKGTTFSMFLKPYNNNKTQMKML